MRKLVCQFTRNEHLYFSNYNKRLLNDNKKYFGNISNIKRDSRFSLLKESDVQYFEKTLENPELSVLTNKKNDLSSYNKDWMKKYEGKSSLVLKPKTTKEVSLILKYCNEKKLAINVQGG